MSESLTFAKTPTSKWNDFEWCLTFFFLSSELPLLGPPTQEARCGATAQEAAVGEGICHVRFPRGHHSARLRLPLHPNPNSSSPGTSAPSTDTRPVSRWIRWNRNMPQGAYSGVIRVHGTRHVTRGFIQNSAASHMMKKADSNWIVKHTGTRWGSVSLVCPRWCMRACQQALCSLVSEETPRPAISL